MIVVSGEDDDGDVAEHRQLDVRRELAPDRDRKVREAAFAVIGIRRFVLVTMTVSVCVFMFVSATVVVGQFMKSEMERREDERSEEERDRGKRRRSPIAQESHRSACIPRTTPEWPRASSENVEHAVS